MHYRLLVVLIVASAFVSSIYGQKNTAESQAVAEVGGEAITLQELLKASGEPLARLEEQAYNLKQ